MWKRKNDIECLRWAWKCRRRAWSSTRSWRRKQPIWFFLAHEGRGHYLSLWNYRECDKSRRRELGQRQRWNHQTEQKLLEARNRRIRPAIDDKILTAWNAPMISAFAAGYVKVVFLMLRHPQLILSLKISERMVNWRYETEKPQFSAHWKIISSSLDCSIRSKSPNGCVKRFNWMTAWMFCDEANGVLQ